MAAPKLTTLITIYSIFHEMLKFRNYRHIHMCLASTAAVAVNGPPTWESQGNPVNPLFPPLFVDNTNARSYASLLQACNDIKSLKKIHTHILVSGLDQNLFLGTKLVSVYAACGSIENARLVFEKTSPRNVVSWTAMIAGYAQNGDANEALTLFRQMQLADVKPNPITMVSVLSACARLGALQQGKWIHDYIIESGIDFNVYVGTALINMYTKCGSVEHARHVFDKMSEGNIFLWNAMISGYAQNGLANEALTLFYQMQLGGVTADKVTLVSALSTCAQLGALQQGKGIHDYITKMGFESNCFVGAALLDMYAKCGAIEDAHRVFVKMAKRDVVSWTAMVVGYAQNGLANEALTLFHQMLLAGVTPDTVAIASVLSACANLGALQQGKWIHDYLIRSEFESDICVGTALVDMYAKCGSIEIARQFFDRMHRRDVVSWNAMIAGYGMHGHGEDALALFSQMQQTGMTPNDITFISVLSACSHAGLVDEGWQYFGCMSRDYCIAPRVKHYACMVDLLGRSGHLDEAEDFIKRMPLQPNACVWGALLGACRIHSNVELGMRVAEHLFDLEPEDTGNYVLLSNIYAAAGRWEYVAKVRTMMKDRGLKKTPGCSLIEVNNQLHAFLVGDRSHPQSDKIYAMLETLAEQMEAAGYIPNTSCVLLDVEEEEKERILYSHSEKLAIAFGLLNTNVETPIRITKNLRVCGDCHTAAKFISKIVERDIIVRDANRFHHFKDGLCSCGDYW